MSTEKAEEKAISSENSPQGWKFVAWPYELFVFEAGLNILQLADSKMYWDTCGFFQGEEDFEMALSRAGKLENLRNVLFLGELSTSVDWQKIYSPYLHDCLMKSIDDERMQTLFSIDRQLKNGIEEVIVSHNLPVVINDEWDPLPLVKYLAPSLEVPRLESYFDGIINIIDWAYKLEDDRLIMCTNATNTLLVEQLNHVTFEAKNKGVVFVFLDNKLSEANFSSFEGNRYTIDEDFVEFRPES